MTVDTLIGILRAHGYKLTPQRRVLLEVIVNSSSHLTTAAIYERVLKKYPTIGLVTIYRVLEILSRLNLICRLHTEKGCRSYLIRNPRGHHHHMVCLVCGRVIGFTGCDLNQIQERLSRDTGFEIESHLLEFNGQCRECLKNASRNTGSPAHLKIPNVQR